MTQRFRTGGVSQPGPERARLRLLALPLAAFMCGGASAQQTAQQYPSRPIRLIVPFAPGGGFDAVARPFAEKLAVVLGQPVVIDNRPGAGGNIGAEQAARAVPDGYTLMFVNDFMSTNPNLYRSLRYDPLRDFVSIAKVTAATIGIAVHPSVAANNLDELIALSNKQPLNFASPGIGTGPHLFGELLNLKAGAKFNHIPYKGTGPAVTDALGGQVQVIITTFAPMVPHIANGRLRGIAVTSDTRSSQLPSVPTVAEAGFPGYSYENWYGLVAPAAVPAPVLKRLQDASAQALVDSELKERLLKIGFEPSSGSAEALTALIKADLVRWSQVVRDAGIPRE